MSKYFGILNQGGFFMYPILVCSIVALTVIVERVYFLFFRLRLQTGDLVGKILHATEGGHINKAIDYSNRFISHPLAKVLNAGLLKANRGDKEIERAMEGAYLEVTPAVQKKTGSLSMLANISTLLGLLGTIQGLIHSFRGIAAADAAQRSEILARGISEALLCTAFGLVVAVTCLVMYFILTNRTNQILDSTQHGATELLNVLSASNHDLRVGPARVTEINRARG